MGLSAGTRLGQYEIVAALGAGGMGEVYRARDTRLQRPAAIKIITADQQDPDMLRRLEREALSASALNHPNILTVYELGAHEGLHYIATELVEGETLRDRIRRGPIPLEPALDIAIQVAAALDAAHAAGIVHRDIKPENVMIRPDGYVKVLDFGIAKLIPSSSVAADSHTLTVQTVPGMLVGTVGYMAPEQIRGLPIDQRADIWSLGVVLHEMLTGRSPFAGPTSSDVIAAVLERTPPPLAESGATAPAELQRILSKMLSKNADDRYQTMKDLLVDLRRLQRESQKYEVRTQNDDAGTKPSSISIPVKGRWIFLAAGLGLTAWLGWIAWSWTQSPAEDSEPPAAASPPATNVPPATTFTYWLTVQTLKNGVAVAEVDSPGTEAFAPGSRFSFNFSNPRPGHVYVLNEATGRVGEPVLTMLYPSPSIRAGSAAVGAGDITKTAAYYFDTKPAVESVWIVWSAEPQADLEAAKAWVVPEHQGRIKDAALAAKLYGLLMRNAARASARVDDQGKRMVVSGRHDLLVHKAELRTQ